MKQLHDLMNDVLINGQERDTRSGKVTGVFRRDFQHDMREGLPFPMTKKLMFKAMMGELLFFLNGKVTISELRRLSGLSDDEVSQAIQLIKGDDKKPAKKTIKKKEIINV